MRHVSSITRAGPIAVLLLAGLVLAQARTVAALEPSGEEFARLRAKIERAADAFAARLPKAAGLAVGALRRNIQGEIEEFWVFRGRIRQDGPPPDQRSLFEIGSITKTFTAAILADMAARGVLDPAAPVQSIYNDKVPGQVRLPRYADAPEITCMDLAAHASGLPRDPAPLPASGCAYPLSAMRAYVSGLKSLAGPPGKRHGYSNLGYGVLSDVLVLAAGAPDYAALLDDFLNRAGLYLPDTALVRAENPPGLIQGREASGRPAPACLRSWPALEGAGALRSSLRDMLAWLRLNLGLTDSPANRLLPALHRPRLATEFGAAGLGWQMRRPVLSPETTVVFKNGGTRGFRSHLGFVAAPVAGAVVLSNANIENDSLGATILNILLGLDFAGDQP